MPEMRHDCEHCGGEPLDRQTRVGDALVRDLASIVRKHAR